MEKKTMDFDFLPKAGPYSHLVEADGFLFCSGVVAVDPETGRVIQNDVRRGTEACLKTLRRMLQSAGSDLDRVVKVTVFLQEMADFGAMNEVYRTFFPDRPPARTCVAVKEIPGGSPLEIEAVALK